MNIKNYTDFGKDLFDVLALGRGQFDDKAFSNFLDTYFDNEEVTSLQKIIKDDIAFFRLKDPASVEYTDAQILSVRRGMLAIVAHRIFEAVMESENAPSNCFEIELLAKTVQARTNIEIHPTAKVGPGFAIDHGHGTVIGATTIMGQNTFIYHGVTLGATGRVNQSGRRHPLLGDGICLGNGVQVLGPSVLGDDISIGSESMILDSVIESNVRISPGVKITRVRVPSGYAIFGFDPFTREFIGRKPGSDQKTEQFQLERVAIEEVTD